MKYMLNILIYSQDLTIMSHQNKKALQNAEPKKAAIAKNSQETVFLYIEKNYDVSP
jgi:hypothetical protein